VLTLFSIPKPFRGHIGVIQTNALQSWIKLEPRCDIILFGDDEGTAETAARFGVKHVSDVARNEYGTPLLNDVFSRAQAMASHDIACYINSDIVLLDDFLKSVAMAAKLNRSFLMVGQRQDADLDHALDFTQPDWQERLRQQAGRHGRPRPPDWIDYFVFSKGLYKQMPPFAIGRTSFDNWLIWEARALGAAVIDASATVLAVHQNHDYTHHPQGQTGVFSGVEAKINRSLMDGRRCYFTIADATHRLTPSGITRNFTSRYARQKWKYATRSLHDWRHRHGLHRAKVDTVINRSLGRQVVPVTTRAKREVVKDVTYRPDMSRRAQNGPLVSVVIPCRNTGQYLTQAIESVLQQDYPRIECIVMDGASTDNTVEILRRYEDRLRWQSAPDRGPQDAINKGWQLCRGEILTWLNADDLWAPGAVSTAVAYFLEHPEADVVYGDCGLIGPAGEFYATMRVSEWDLGYAVEHCDHIIHQAASFIRREILERVGWLQDKLCHDHDLWLRISLAGGKLQRIPALLAFARDRSENLGNRSDEVIALKVGLTEKFFAQPNLPPELARLRRRAISNAYLRCVEFMLKDSRPKQELRQRIVGAVRRSVQSDPSNLIPAALRLRSALKRLSRRFSSRPAERPRKSRSSGLVINPLSNASAVALVTEERSANDSA
jgi:glycosyltransferase involved in cell wall biosynthesis